MKKHKRGDCANKPENHKTGILQQIKAYLGHRRLGELLVINGRISPQDLRQALSAQKENGLHLGQVLVQNSMITRGELRMALARQTALRAVAALIFISFSGFGGKRALADIPDAPARISVALSMGAQAYQPVVSYPELLGTGEKRSTNLSAFTKWSGVFAKFERQIDNPNDQKTINEWRENLQSFRGLPLLSMAERVNDLMNQQPYILDSKNWGVSDYWETPVEFLQRGGDCEDFAIAKYMSLRVLGVPEERLRVAIVQDTQKNIPHAVLALYADDGVYILDNQNKSIVNGEHEGRYRPIFSINRTAWWLHTSPDATQMASRD